MNKVVFAPLSNTYSHITDCLAVADQLADRGCQIHFLASRDKQNFVATQGYPVTPTLELWEGRGEQEVMSWFDDPLWFRDVAVDELRVLQDLRPDLVVGSYRYTTRITCRRLGLPYFSIMGPNMAPTFHRYLGIPRELVDDRAIEVLLRIYRERLENVKTALPDWDWSDLPEMRSLLLGRRTFFHTLSEIEPLDGLDDSYAYVGPLHWQGWRQYSPSPDYSSKANCRVLVFLGSVIASPEALGKLVVALDRPGLESLVVGAAAPEGISPRLHFTPAVDLEAAIASCDLAVIHGGLNIFQHCLALGKPCLVIPHQVEQAQNALIGEQLGIAHNLLGRGLKGELSAVASGDVIKRLKVFLRYQQEISKASVDQLATAVEEASVNLEWRARCQSIGSLWQPRFQAHHGAREIAAAIQQQLSGAT